MLRDATIQLRDGRTLAYATWGDPNGLPLLRFHGTPGSRYRRHPDSGLYERAGAHLASFDRPGYGGSSPDRERTILSVADDALELADALGWTRFSVLGGSGGGPHALALGFRAPDRVRRIGLVVGAVPRDFVEESEVIDVNREALRRAAQGRSSLEAFMAEPATLLQADPAGTFENMMRDAPEADRAFLKRPEVRAVLIDDLREAFRAGPVGWFDDVWALMQPWGFDVEAVHADVWIWHGDLDRNSPLSAMRRLAARLQVASFTELPNHGHVGLFGIEDVIVRTLLD